ncbi:MAG: hypothetical protein FWD66_11110 [Paludibacter sp.]|nr:hypothetical protein [Paludibacter sp.]
MDNKILFYRLLQSNPVGYKKDLEKNFVKSNGVNFDEIYDSSMLVGILRAGIDGTFEDRYKVTEFGKSQIVTFLDLYNYIHN